MWGDVGRGGVASEKVIRVGEGGESRDKGVGTKEEAPVEVEEGDIRPLGGREADGSEREGNKAAPRFQLNR